MVIAMQAVAFISLIMNGALGIQATKEVAMLSKKEVFLYSKETNVNSPRCESYSYKYF